jgi:hypothetical protein
MLNGLIHFNSALLKYLYAEHAPYWSICSCLSLLKDIVDVAEIARHELDLRRLLEKSLCRCRLSVSCQGENLKWCVRLEKCVDNRTALLACCASDEKCSRCHCERFRDLEWIVVRVSRL